MTAFFDDSGEPEPTSGRNVFCLGMVVMPASVIRECSNKWENVVASGFGISASSLTVNGIEAKSADLHELQRRLAVGSPLNTSLENISRMGLNSHPKVSALIDELWTFLSTPPLPVKYLSIAVNKSANWTRFQGQKYTDWQALQGVQGSRGKAKDLAAELAQDVAWKAYDWLLQRLEYLGDDSDFKFSDALVVGDETKLQRMMYRSQARTRAGMKSFTTLPKIANNVWFGSSLYNPCIQMADWVAFATRTWAEHRPVGKSRLSQILGNFRGSPGNVGGRGVVLVPDSQDFPPLP